MPKDQKIIQKSDLLAPDVYEKNRRQLRKELVEFKKDRRVPQKNCPRGQLAYGDFFHMISISPP